MSRDPWRQFSVGFVLVKTNNGGPPVQLPANNPSHVIYSEWKVSFLAASLKTPPDNYGRTTRVFWSFVLTIHVGLGGHSREHLTWTSTFNLPNLPQHYVLLCTMYIDVQAGSHKANRSKSSRSKKLQRPCGARCSATHALPEFPPARKARDQPVTRFPSAWVLTNTFFCFGACIRIS